MTEITNEIVDDINDQKQDEISIKLGFPTNDWERISYENGCIAAKNDALEKLKSIEEKLHETRPKGYKVIGFYSRKILTVFGEITVRRRLYKDSEGVYHFLLDEYLNWRPNQQATPSLTEALADSTTRLTFRDTEVYSRRYISIHRPSNIWKCHRRRTKAA